MQPKKSKQNRVDYIVYNSPRKANKILAKYGFESIKNPEHLSIATKQLIQQEGKKVFEDLLAIHPDRKAILALEKPMESRICQSCKASMDQQEDSYCNSCAHSNFKDDDQTAFQEKISKMNQAELKDLFSETFSKSNENPSDKELASQTQTIWYELRNKEKKKTSEEEESKEPTQKTFSFNVKEIGFALLLTGLVGYVIGSRARQPITSQ